ncbi:unc-13-like protein [Drosera capensis]
MICSKCRKGGRGTRGKRVQKVASQPRSKIRFEFGAAVWLRLCFGDVGAMWLETSQQPHQWRWLEQRRWQSGRRQRINLVAFDVMIWVTIRCISVNEVVAHAQEFFVADGEGLGCSLVEQEASFAQQVVTMFSNQTGTIIQGLMNASERTPGHMQSYRLGNRSLVDADVLIRVLCHKKDREASKFLKSQYRLPKSSEYEETSMNVSSSSSSIISDLMNRSASLRWTGIGHSSSIPSKKQNQTSTNESPSGPSIMSDLLNRSKSLRWTETGSSSFRSLRNKLHL